MKIEISTDSHINGSGLEPSVERLATAALTPHVPKITRLEVHLTDVNGGKGGADDKRCMMEARLEGRQPEAATHSADTVEKAIKGAAEKLRRVLDTSIGRLRDAR